MNIAIHPNVRVNTITRVEGVDIEIIRADNITSAIHRNVNVDVVVSNVCTTVQIIERTDICADGQGNHIACYVEPVYVSINPTCRQTER